MSEVELHINVSGAGKPEQVAKLVQDAMAIRETQARTVIPDGYRCVGCYRGDGTHEAQCQFTLARREAGR